MALDASTPSWNNDIEFKYYMTNFYIHPPLQTSGPGAFLSWDTAGQSDTDSAGCEHSVAETEACKYVHTIR